ncbi:MAG: DNA (cytosine-5-)-methyltransferase [Defluviitaleaceae bacterium]|nr:DNA (cytosine-5-)-methyltransferase [Defluviitaleaceae bacterium]
MKITAVDLFCGIGGLTHGLMLAGLDVVVGFDIDSTCQYAYEINNNAVFIKADISTISATDISKHYNDSDIKVLVGCAPCQPFSKYTMRYRKNAESGVANSDNSDKNHDKWGLVESFAEKIHQILPDIVSMENVPELINTNVFENFLNTLEACNYHVSYCVAFCPDYGVPQNRKRLVLLASRLGAISLIEPQYTPDKYITVKAAIGKLSKLKAGEKHADDMLHFCARLNDTNIKRIEASKQGGTWREWDESLQLECHKKSSGKTYGAVYGRMSWDLPSPTITTQFYGYGNGRFGHPEQDRAISWREGALLQSFPPDYALIDPTKEINRRVIGTHIGNAVPVELGRAIGISIKNHIEEVIGSE